MARRGRLRRLCTGQTVLHSGGVDVLVALFPEPLESDRYILRSVTDEIMVALQRLGEQRYEDVYASTVKDRLASAQAAKAPSARH